MRQHPLDSEVGFPGIGGTEYGGDAGAAGTQLTIGRRRKGYRHSEARHSRLAKWERRFSRWLWRDRQTACVSQRDAVQFLRLPVLKVWNESGTNHGRIADSQVVRLCSPRDMEWQVQGNTRSGVRRNFSPCCARRN